MRGKDNFRRGDEGSEVALKETCRLWTVKNGSESWDGREIRIKVATIIFEGVSGKPRGCKVYCDPVNKKDHNNGMGDGRGKE